MQVEIALVLGIINDFPLHSGQLENYEIVDTMHLIKFQEITLLRSPYMKIQIEVIFDTILATLFHCIGYGRSESFAAAASLTIATWRKALF